MTKTQRETSKKKGRNVVQKTAFKHEKHDVYKAKKSADTNILYKKKFSQSVPSRKKQKNRYNRYNATEEARLEKIVFGDSTDIISKLTENNSASHVVAKGKLDAKKRRRKRSASRKKKATLKDASTGKFATSFNK